MKTFFRSLLMLICILIASCHRLPEGVVKCIECKGKGKVIICKYCKEGYYYCSRCSRGWIVCQYCQNGYQKCINCQTGYTLCHYCNMGYQPCSKCNKVLLRFSHKTEWRSLEKRLVRSVRVQVKNDVVCARGHTRNRAGFVMEVVKGYVYIAKECFG